MKKNTYIFNLAQQFEKIVSKYGDESAIIYPDKKAHTFSELDVISDKIACFLLSKSVKKGDVICILNEKSFSSYALMIACLKTGIIYVNLDPASPEERLQKIVQKCLPKIIFTDEIIEKEFKFLNSNGLEVVALTEVNNDVTLDKVELNYSEINGNDPAYIMFTSGSTGFPKGAVISHDNVLKFIHWGQFTFDVDPLDIFTNANPIYFDNSVFDFYVSLFNGAKLLSISHQLAKVPHELVKTINANKCTVWFSVPSLLVYLLTTKSISANDFTGVKKIIFGGEGFPKNKLKKLHDYFGHRMQLFNVYGPTECTCICSSYLISERDFENMNELSPLGKMAPNFGYYILDENQQKTNFGELYLSGPCVGLGYYNDEERTAASFINLPSSNFINKVYKTGDLVELDSGGMIHFRGRVDNQIKHMGYRIELEEIEAAFSSLEYIDECGVIFHKKNTDFGFIIAFISVNKEIDKDFVFEDLKKIIPSYMVPREIHFFEILPKNQNGKIDRSQLKNLL